MRPIRLSILVVWSCFGMWTAVATAQGRTSTTGNTQQTTTQNSGSTGTSASTGIGTTGSSGGTAPQMSTGNQPTFNAADGSVGAQVGQSGFTGRTNTAFAGNRNAAQSANTSLTPQFTPVNNPSNTENRGNTGNSNIKRARPQLHIAFTIPKANLATAQVQLGGHFKRLSSMTGVETAITDDGIATLTGSVASEDSRKLAEIFTRQEPGVRSVVNQLRVEAISP